MGMLTTLTSTSRITSHSCDSYVSIQGQFNVQAKKITCIWHENAACFETAGSTRPSKLPDGYHNLQLLRSHK